jgi:hypothetical protein
MGVSGQRHAPAALPLGKTRYPLYRRLGGSQGWSGQVRKISPPPGFDPRTVQPLASRYTDCAILAQSEHCYLAKSVTDKLIFILLPDAWLMKLSHTNCELHSADLCYTCMWTGIPRNLSHQSNMQDFGRKFHQKCLSRSTFIYPIIIIIIIIIIFSDTAAQRVLWPPRS